MAGTAGGGRFVIGSAWVEIRADVDKFQKDLTDHVGGGTTRKKIEDEGHKSGASFGKKFGASFGSTLGALGVWQGINQVVGGSINFLKESVGEQQEAIKVNRDTQAAIDSTGGAAGRTAEQIGKLSERTAEMIGQDDELVQRNANVLLSFNKVNGEIFDRSLPLISDLSARMGIDGPAASKTLGKALQDPIGGLGALSKAGVKFTEEEKDRIKVLTESGKQHEAQALILDKVAVSVGGSAAAQTTGLDKLKVSFDNIKEHVGAILMPILEKFSAWFSEKASPAIHAFISGLKGEDVEGAFQPFKDAGDKVRVVFTWLGDNKDMVIGALAGIGAAIVAIGVAMVANPIGLIATAIAAVVSGLIYAYTHFEGFKNVVDTVFRVAMDITKGWWAVMQTVWDWLRDVAWPFIRDLWGTIGPVIQGAWNIFIRPAIEAWWAYMQMLWGWMRDVAWPFIQSFWTNISNAVRAFWGFVEPIIRAWWDGMQSLWNWISTVAWPAMQTFWNNLRETIRLAVEFISQRWDIFKLNLQFLRDKVQEVIEAVKLKWQEFQDKIAAVVQWITDRWNLFKEDMNLLRDKAFEIADAIGNKWEEFKNRVAGIWESLRVAIHTTWDQIVQTGKDKINDLGRLVNNIIKAVNKIPFVKVPELDEPIFAAEGGGVGGARPASDRMLAGGGSVNGGPPGTDTVPAVGPYGVRYRLDNGEHIFTKREVAMMGGQGAVYAFRSMIRAGNISRALGLINPNRRIRGDGSEGLSALGLEEGGSIGGLVELAKVRLRAAAGTPYSLGSAGPGAFDCSGLVGMVYNTLTGQSPYKRVFTTHNMDKFFTPGKGTFTVGWSHAGERGASAGDGHTAGNLDGLAFESRGGDGTVLGAGAANIMNFMRQGYLPVAGGRFVPGGGGGGGGFVSWLMGAAGRAAKAALDAAISALEGALPQGDEVAPASIRGVFAGIPKAARDFFENSANTSDGGSVSGSLGEWIEAAKKFVNIEWVQGLQTLIMRESGGNPRAINNWDSNAAKGTPSKGLMQTIDPTFNAHRHPDLPNDPFDPVANIVAGMRYIHSRYGSLFNVQQAHADRAPMGYARGVKRAPSGLALVGEGGYPELMNMRGGEAVTPIRGSVWKDNVFHVTIPARDFEEFRTVLNFFDTIEQTAIAGDRRVA